jgi:aminoglycoside 3-N-acetyltransferase I
MTCSIVRLEPTQVPLMRELNRLFGEVFADSASYASAPPSDSYLEQVLGKRETIVLVATQAGRVIAGLVAYVLDKLEQERSEIYIYDLAVAEAFRRQGMATALIAELKHIAAAENAWVIYVQADYGDEPAVALYEKLGAREDVMHFDIAPAALR